MKIHPTAQERTAMTGLNEDGNRETENQGDGEKQTHHSSLTPGGPLPEFRRV